MRVQHVYNFLIFSKQSQSGNSTCISPATIVSRLMQFAFTFQFPIFQIYHREFRATGEVSYCFAISIFFIIHQTKHFFSFVEPFFHSHSRFLSLLSNVEIMTFLIFLLTRKKPSECNRKDVIALQTCSSLSYD